MALTLMQTGGISGNLHGVAAAFVASLLSLSVFVIIERRTKSPLLDFRLLREKTLLPSYLILMAIGITMFMAYPSMAVIATGLSLAITATWNIVVSESPKEFIGISTAVGALLLFIGMSTGPAVAGVYMANHGTINGVQGSYPTLGSYNLVFLTSGLLSGISLGIALVLDRRVAQRATQGLTSLLNGVGLWHK